MNWRQYHALQHTVELGGQSIAFVELGEGDPIVLLHGVPGWGYLWHRFAPLLATRFRVLVPDLPGFGFSPAAPSQMAVLSQAELLSGWLRELDLHGVTLIAHDVHAAVALKMPGLAGMRIAKLVLLNPLSFDAWPMEAMLRLAAFTGTGRLSRDTAFGLLDTMVHRGFRSRPDSRTISSFLHSEPMNSEPMNREPMSCELINTETTDSELANRKEPQRDPAVQRVADAVAANLPCAELSPLVPPLDVPTLLVWGDDDLFQPAQTAESLAFDIPDADSLRIIGSRQFAVLEEPERVVEEIFPFLCGEAPEENSVPQLPLHALS